MAGMIKDNMTIASAQTVIKNGTATLSFPVRDLDEGKYTVEIPAGMFKVNGALLGCYTQEFNVSKPIDGIDTILSDGTVTDIYSIDGHLVAPQTDAAALRELAPGIYINSS